MACSCVQKEEKERALKFVHAKNAKLSIVIMGINFLSYCSSVILGRSSISQEGSSTTTAVTKQCNKIVEK